MNVNNTFACLDYRLFYDECVPYPVIFTSKNYLLRSQVNPVSKAMIIQKQPCEYYRRNSRDKLLEENL